MIKMNLNVGMSQLQVSQSPQRRKSEEGDLIQKGSSSAENVLNTQKWAFNTGNNNSGQRSLALGE
jgi:hypothetical protein